MTFLLSATDPDRTENQIGKTRTGDRNLERQNIIESWNYFSMLELTDLKTELKSYSIRNE